MFYWFLGPFYTKSVLKIEFSHWDLFNRELETIAAFNSRLTRHWWMCVCTERAMNPTKINSIDCTLMGSFFSSLLLCSSRELEWCCNAMLRILCVIRWKLLHKQNSGMLVLRSETIDCIQCFCRSELKSSAQLGCMAQMDAINRQQLFELTVGQTWCSHRKAKRN